MSGYNLPPNVSAADPNDPWNQGLTDEEVLRRRELADQGLALIDILNDLLDEAEIWFDFMPLISALKRFKGE